MPVETVSTRLVVIAAQNMREPDIPARSDAKRPTDIFVPQFVEMEINLAPVDTKIRDGAPHGDKVLAEFECPRDAGCFYNGVYPAPTG